MKRSAKREAASGGKEQACRHCGCTEARACPGGCFWVFPDLCSACVFKALNATIPGLPLAVQSDVMDPLMDMSREIVERLDAADAREGEIRVEVHDG